MFKVSYWKKLQNSCYSQVWSCRRALLRTVILCSFLCKSVGHCPGKTACESQNKDSKMCAGRFWFGFFFGQSSFPVVNILFVGRWGPFLKVVRTACPCGRFSSSSLPVKYYRSSSTTLSGWHEGQRHQSGSATVAAQGILKLYLNVVTLWHARSGQQPSL